MRRFDPKAHHRQWADPTGLMKHLPAASSAEVFKKSTETVRGARRSNHEQRIDPAAGSGRSAKVFRHGALSTLTLATPSSTTPIGAHA